MKLVTIVGARPQFIKAAPVSLQLRRHVREILVNTGQHYDPSMSDIFFRELALPAPDYNLGVGSGSHGEQTGRMLIEVERVLLFERPDIVLVYGDTNSTLAGALAAAKLHIPVAHVEAGLRSFNREMPEEINRVLTDHISTWLFAPTETAVSNLSREGVVQGVYNVGDVMADSTRIFLGRTDAVKVRSSFGVEHGGYCLLTLHRPANVDDPGALSAILSAVDRSELPVIFPVHPRTRARLDTPELRDLLRRTQAIRLVEPVGYLEMLALEQGAAMILTDSGGVQKEAFMLGIPCVTLRAETEWVETVEAGWNHLAGADPERIIFAMGVARSVQGEPPPLYGDGHAAERIASVLVESARA